MAPSRCFSDRALVLGRRPFRENDEVITLFTSRRGKFDALARGVKKPASRLKYLLQPAIVFEVELLQGEGYPTVVGGEMLMNSTGIGACHQIAASCFAGLGFIDAITADCDPDSRLFTLTVHFLKALQERVESLSRDPGEGEDPVNKNDIGEVSLILGFKLKASSLAGFLEPSALAGLGKRCRDLAVALHCTPMSNLPSIKVSPTDAQKIDRAVDLAFEKNSG